MPWYRIAFTELEVEEGAPGRLEKALRQAFTAAGNPKEAVVFCNERAADGIEYYLAPQAGRIADEVLAQYRAAPCPQPQADDVRHALGHRATGERVLAHRGED